MTLETETTESLQSKQQQFIKDFLFWTTQTLCVVALCCTIIYIFIFSFINIFFFSQVLLKFSCLLLLRAFPLSARVALSFLLTVSFKFNFFHLPHVLAMAMTHILLTLAYEETALISAMPVWALLIIFIDVDVDTILSSEWPQIQPKKCSLRYSSGIVLGVSPFHPVCQ